MEIDVRGSGTRRAEPCCERRSASQGGGRASISFQTKIAGVTFDNADGTNRQRVIAQLQPGDTLVLSLDRRNPHDANAVKVCTTSGEQIGFLPKKVASQMRHYLRSGGRATCTIKQITGGGTSTASLFLGVVVWIARPG